MGNRIVNYVPIKQDIYEVSTTKNGDIGSVLEYEDGRKFVYCMNGTTDTLTPGNFCNGPIENTSDYDEAVAIQTSIAVRDKTISITTQRSYTESELADGWVIIEGETGAYMGHMRKIKSHPAASSGETLIIAVYDAWTDVATAGTDTVNLLKNPYSGVVENVATTVGPLLGIAPCDVTVSTSTTKYYFWLQVAGPAPMIAAEIIAVGAVISIDDGAGLAYVRNASTESQLIGLAMQTAESGNGIIVWLNLR